MEARHILIKYRLGPFWIRLKYGAHTNLEESMEFDLRGFTIVYDVLERVRREFRNSDVYLYNEHGVELEMDDVIQKARTYTLKRLPKNVFKMTGVISSSLTRVLTLNPIININTKLANRKR